MRRVWPWIAVAGWLLFTNAGQVQAAPVPPALGAPPEVAADTILWKPAVLRRSVRLAGSLLEDRPPAFVALGQARLERPQLMGRDPTPLRRTATSPEGAFDGFDVALAVAQSRLLRLGWLGPMIRYGDVPLGSPAQGARVAQSSRLVNEFADLGFEVRGIGELGGDWTRFRPCDSAVQASCSPSALPQLRPDIQFSVTADGTVTDRIRVDVDYDQTRDFSGANRISINYQGLPGEVLQSFQVGDVTFDLPQSRYLREGIPAGNFGFQANLQAGPISLESVWAQQSGEVTRRRFELGGSGRSFSQVDTLVQDDADFADGQFFFLFDPEVFREFPHIDILSTVASDVPLSIVPGADPIQLYRSEVDLFAQQQVEGLIQADATAEKNGDVVTESAWFRYLQPGRDYVVHPSGLWVALRAPLRPNEMLAVTYVTATSDTVGTYNPERVFRQGGRPELKLLKASSGLHQPGRPTWETAMRQVYRVSGSNDVDPEDVELTVSLGAESAGRTFTRRPNGEDLTYLRLFGLDEDSPRDRIDESHIYRPAIDSFDDQPPVSGTYIVFPTLEPFRSPPPLSGLSLSGDEVAEILGPDRNDRIYDAADPFERGNGGVFRLNLIYQARSDGVLSTFSLGAVGIREGSERVLLGDRALIRNVDYSVDYMIGQVTLLNPESSLAASPSRTLEISWEQRSLFQIAPASVFGVNAKYDVGQYGAVYLIGLYQSEDELLRRPRLGSEASGVGLTGLNGNLNFRATILDRILRAIPGLAPGAASTLRIRGETTVSLPNPNTQGDVYLDDFDATNARRLSVLGADWRRGSRPDLSDGAEGVLPALLDQTNKAPMTWQHSWIVENTEGDSLGVFKGFDPTGDIDRQIRVVGSVARDPGLAVRFEPENGDVTGELSWSSVTTVLSPTGMDLTKTDFLEFYVEDGDFLTLVLDLGTVSEDAFFLDENGGLNGVKPGSGVPWGLGFLDQEADPRRGEIWSNVTDGRGVWEEACVAERARVYRLGDPNTNCTRGNGRPDSEDMDEDGNLDTLERYRRYVVTLDGSSPFLIRDRDATQTGFRLYRVPIRSPRAVDVGGTISEAELRAVRHLRMSVTGRRRDSFVLTRLNLVGSRWIKRALTGVLRGIGGDTASFSGRVEVGPVSKVTVGAAYESPPAVLEQLDDPTSGFGGQGIEFNERSLSIEFSDVESGARTEVYNRFPQRPRDFLSYREARLWVVARSGDFGLDESSYFFLKVGTDDENFYLYRTPLQLAANPRAVAASDWLPEVVVDFEEWLDLRRQAEAIIIIDPPTAADPPVVLWSADSTYAIVLKDRGRAPNLASVREMSLGVMNEGLNPIQGEVWIDELRLGRGVRTSGVASALDIELDGGDFLTSRISFRNRGAFFRQLKGSPSFQDDRTLDLQTTLELARFTPEEWNLRIPVTVAHQTDRSAPTFLGRSDVRADRLEGLRTPSFNRTRVDIGMRRAQAIEGGLWSDLLNGLSLRAGYVRSSFTTITSENLGDGMDGFVGYSTVPERREITLFPGALGDLMRRLLPGFLERRIVDARLRWTPQRVRLESDLVRRNSNVRRFDQIIRQPSDSVVLATRSPRRNLTTVAEVAFRPFESVSASVDLVSGRDLLSPDLLADELERQKLLEGERRSLGGLDLGWEVDRRLRTNLTFQPRLADWARTSLRVSSVYFSERSPELIERRFSESDSSLALQRNADGQRNLTASFSVDPRRALLDRGSGRGTGWGFARALARSLEPIAVTYSDGITSRFNRQAVNPGAAYQFGWGGRDDFLFSGGGSASTLSERNRTSIRGGISLPGSLLFNATYDRSLNQTLDTRSDRQVLARVWPDVRVSATNVPVPGFMSPRLTRISVNTGFRRATRVLEFGSGGRQGRLRDDVEIPFGFRLGFTGGIDLRYRGGWQDGDGMDPTGETAREGQSHSLLLSALFTSPFQAFRDKNAPLRLTLDLSYNDEVQCRTTQVTGPCVAFIDQLERIAAASLDSTVRDFQVGLQFRFVDRRSFVGQKVGSTQFQLNVFGQFLLSAGMFPAF